MTKELNTDTWYVLADGTHADPKEVIEKDGVLQHKNGVPVAMRDSGHPLTSGVATRENKKAADAGKENDPPAGDEQNRESKADDGKKGSYKNRESKAE